MNGLQWVNRFLVGPFNLLLCFESRGLDQHVKILNAKTNARMLRANDFDFITESDSNSQQIRIYIHKISGYLLQQQSILD